MTELDKPIGTGAGEGKHGQAAGVIAAALAARRDGRGDEADRLLAEARRIDPEAVTAALERAPDSLADDDASGTAGDEEVAAISREVPPGAAAPSRAGITGSNSGSDN